MRNGLRRVDVGPVRHYPPALTHQGFREAQRRIATGGDTFLNDTLT